MSNKVMQRWSASLGTREIKIKTTMRHYNTPITWINLVTPTTPKASEDEGQL